MNTQENNYGLISALDKQVNITGTLEDLNLMIIEACGIRRCPLPVIAGKDRVIIDLLFHKKRKALCLENNPRFQSANFYS